MPWKYGQVCQIWSRLISKSDRPLGLSKGIDMGKRLLCEVFLVLFFFVPSIGATDISVLYDDETLRYWQPVHQEDILWNFENVILPKLSLPEKQVLRDVILSFPLRGSGKDIFEFYAEPAQYKVTLPILSIRFFADISLAQAWLVENGYSVSTVYQYIGFLKYHARQMQGPIPSPLPALKIPINAWNNPRVSDLYSKSLTTAILFLLCHELAHVYFQHPSYERISAEAARQNEAEADRFAVDIMCRIGLIPIGGGLWFSSLVRWQYNQWDYGSKKEWEDYLKGATHPLTAFRIRSLAALLGEKRIAFSRSQVSEESGVALVSAMARDLEGVAEILEDADIQRLMQIEGLSTQIDMLVPRYTDTYVAQAKPPALNDDRVIQMGQYAGRFDAVSEGSGGDITTILERTDRVVSGSYTYATAKGELKGLLTGNMLTFRWVEGGASGKGRFVMDGSETSFSGTWGYMNSYDDGGTWNGKRQ